MQGPEPKQRKKGVFAHVLKISQNTIPYQNNHENMQSYNVWGAGLVVRNWAVALVFDAHNEWEVHLFAAWEVS